MSLNDDEPIVAKQYSSSDYCSTPFDDGKITATIINKKTAPLVKNSFDVKIKLATSSTYGLQTGRVDAIMLMSDDNSDGGMFPDGQDLKHLRPAVQDLMLTVSAQGESKIKEVHAEKSKRSKKGNLEIMGVLEEGNYKQSRNGDSVTIYFSNLYCQEVCKIKVTLNLFSVAGEQVETDLKIAYKYRFLKQDQVAAPLFVGITRTASIATPHGVGGMG